MTTAVGRDATAALRHEVRAWLAANPHPSGVQLAERGLVAPHWPVPWGLGADAASQLAIDEELGRAGVRRPINPIGIGWAGPTLLEGGTAAQQARWLPGILSGAQLWCQLFSEPDAGSDLASLRTRAVRDGDEWVVNGAKIWTSLAHVASFGILLARTDADAEPHQGISYFVCPMDLDGIEVRPIVDMTGDHAFNEVFFDDVRIPADHLVGEVHRGWRLAKVTLGNERVSLSGEGALWGRGPTAAHLVERSRGHALSALQRDALVRVWSEGKVLSLLRDRLVAAALRGEPPGPEASVRKALADDHGQHVMGLAKDLAGTAGVLVGTGPFGQGGQGGAEWSHGFLYAQALTIGGGTAAVQRNIVAERVLGLPRDPAP
ncbi:MAG TPA: acyl-CoA dehydrogenase family protein [Acidimicrobiales bacterium]|nr:acyl-CoA dehydrogenase family protein [Acidimicrobiales bacterium]